MRVTKVKIERIDSPVKLYDFTVPKWHNFILHKGVAAHQSDADPD